MTGCTGTMHTFVGDDMGTAPWCECGKVRNKWHRRTWREVLTGRPRRPRVRSS